MELSKIKEILASLKKGNEIILERPGGCGRHNRVSIIRLEAGRYVRIEWSNSDPVDREDEISIDAEAAHKTISTWLEKYGSESASIHR